MHTGLVYPDSKVVSRVLNETPSIMVHGFRAMLSGFRVSEVWTLEKALLEYRGSWVDASTGNIPPERKELAKRIVDTISDYVLRSKGRIFDGKRLDSLNKFKDPINSTGIAKDKAAPKDWKGIDFDDVLKESSGIKDDTPVFLAVDKQRDGTPLIVGVGKAVKCGAQGLSFNEASVNSTILRRID